jgi:hypothetical protein
VSGNNGAVQNPSSLRQCAREKGSGEHILTLTAADDRSPDAKKARWVGRLIQHLTLGLSCEMAAAAILAGA